MNPFLKKDQMCFSESTKKGIWQILRGNNSTYSKLASFKD